MTMPLVAFGFDRLDFTFAMRIITAAFWSMDLVVTFFTGYHDAGVVVGLPTQIAWRYITRGFVIDAGVVLVDWFTIASENVEASGILDVARLSKVIRMVRLLRILRLLRVMKFVALSAKFTDMVAMAMSHGQAIWEFMGIVKLLGTVVVVNHFIACGWYALGDAQDPEDTWIRPLVEEDASMAYRYVTSFHWALAQFTPAPNNWHPTNAQERTFAIGTLLFGFTMFSSFLGSITSLLTHIRNSAIRRTEEDLCIREFLHQNNVSLQLGNRIVTFLKHRRIDSKRRVLEQDVVAFQELPGSLRMELHYEVYSKALEPHPLFWQMDNAQRGVVCEVCHEAMSQKYLTKGHELFRQGSPAESAFCALSEGVEYSWFTTRGANVHRFHRRSMEDGSWLCEVALWSKWWHRGQATATVQCTIAAISSEDFRHTIIRHPMAMGICRRYAQLFISYLTCVRLDDQLDDWCSKDTAQELAQKALEAYIAENEVELNSPSPLSNFRSPKRVLLKRTEGGVRSQFRRHSLIRQLGRNLGLNTHTGNAVETVTVATPASSEGGGFRRAASRSLA